MIDFYCTSSQLTVRKGEKTLSRLDLDELTTKELLHYKVSMHGKRVDLKILPSGEICFQFLGADHNQRYAARTPATELLKDLQKLARYYDPVSQQLYF